MEEFEDCLSSFSSPSSFSSAFSNHHPLPIGSVSWLIAEQVTQEILSVIQPTLVSDWRRMEVIDYIKRLIRDHFGTEVFTFGSVPLKTYLLDGDIDLTAVSPQIVEDDLARGIYNILESETRNNTELVVKDVQYIPAQVKIVKCTVQNIAIDISFNQIEGFCSLCFLEQVDEYIGKDHMLKRSIILIKAWCYYESRILGAHHGLISTYALETLILYIINIFHSSLHGPLAVLYKFLDYYSTFDWDKYCVSLNGPVSIMSLPEIAVAAPDNDGSDFLLAKECLENCVEYFSVPIRAHENKEQAFMLKHLNIMDPLKDNNNLGRSVSKGNLRRIRSALSYGARKLKDILMQPGDNMDEGLRKFFVNTLNRNQRVKMSDIYSELSDLTGDYQSHWSGLYYAQIYHNYILPVPILYDPSTSPPLVENNAESNEFMPQSFLDTSLGVFEESSSFQRNDENTPVARQEGFVVRGKGKCNRDMMKVREKGKGGIFEGIDEYMLEMSLEENVEPRGSTSGKGKGKSWRVATYYSNAKSNESKRRGCLMKSAENNGQIEAFSEPNKDGRSDSFNLSLDEFPPLPSSKRAVSVDECRSLLTITPLLNVENIEFGTLGSVVSNGVSAIEKEMPSKSTEGEQEKVPVEAYQLGDTDEFPPLLSSPSQRRHGLKKD